MSLVGEHVCIIVGALDIGGHHQAPIEVQAAQRGALAALAGSLACMTISH